MMLKPEKDENEARLQVVQQRNGKTGTVNLVFVPEYARYENM
jgi:replicative DNA helicase